MNKPVILTGLRANQDLHIGNYFGALLPLIDMATSHADEYEINLFVPDLHSFTTPIDFAQLHNQTMHNLQLFVTAGLPLDHPNIHLYRQSFIPAHSELAWILSCFTGFGEMRRMTQFKDKSSQSSGETDQETGDEQRVSVGLFNYPILMAADILLYGAQYIPVGDDQSQHVEFARDIAERLNKQFGDLFVIPESVAKQHEFFGKDQGLRIRDLIDPTKKMSKSDSTGKGVIFLGDSPATAVAKIMSATTDSFTDGAKLDWQSRPGVSNLLQILALLEKKPLPEIEQTWSGNQNYSELKSAVADKVGQFLTDFQRKLTQTDEQLLSAKLEKDEKTMNEQANARLYKVQQALGLRS